MKIKTVDNLVRISLDVRAVDILKVQKYQPENFILRDDKENAYFALSVTSNTLAPLGDLDVNGAMFKIVGDNCVSWIMLPTCALEDKKEYMTEHFGMTLANLKKVEDNIKAAIENVNAEIAGIDEAFDDEDMA